MICYTMLEGILSCKSASAAKLELLGSGSFFFFEVMLSVLYETGEVIF